MAVAFPVLFLCGCAAVGPDYKQPEIQTPDAWSAEISEKVETGQESSLQTWWTIFDDPVLDEMIERGRQANLDVQIAVERVAEARASLGTIKGERLPVVTAGANASLEELSESESASGADSTVKSYDLGLGASWEIDVFGRVRRSIEAAGARYQATIEDYRDVMVTLYAEIAGAYFDIRSAQQRIISAQANADSMAKSLQLAEDRFSSGVSSRLDVVQARASLEEARATIPLLRIDLVQAINRLAILLGQEAGSLQHEFASPAPLPVTHGLAGIGVPADVLRQRPDIRRAERELAAQSAIVGVATSYLYPSFSLAGFFGLQSDSLSDLFDSSALAWGIQSPVQWDVFNGGRIRQNVELQNARLRQRLLQYRLKVLKAIEEVENAIAAYNLNQQSEQHLVNASDAIDEAVQLVLVQYDTGITEFNNVLTTQRIQLSQQDQLIVTQTQAGLALIDLYRALGGGWNPDDAIPASVSP